MVQVTKYFYLYLTSNNSLAINKEENHKEKLNSN